MDEADAAQWARLRVQLRDTGQRMPLNHSWIAATAMAQGVPVVTQDDHFPTVEGLTIIRV